MTTAGMSLAEPDLALAGRLFDALSERTRQGRGIVRDSYGPGEVVAHDLMRETARSLGLEVQVDAGCNTYAVLPGRDRSAPMLLMGSHLDSVPQGGNFDGAAGVIAGMAVLAGLRRAKVAPPFDIGVIATRGEEAAWFNADYVGTHVAFGRLRPELLDSVRRSDSGRTMAEHMAEIGCDVEAIRQGAAHLRPERLRGYIELHIEQGPVLEAAGIPVAVVTGIRGCLRFRNARCVGTYAHSGAEPRATRHDAVAATVDLIYRLQQEWVAMEAAGEDLTFTTGEFFTDPRMHGPSKVAGETRFVLDFRSISDDAMNRMRAKAEAFAADAARRFGVAFELGEPSYSFPGPMDAALRARHLAMAGSLGIRAIEMASGAGHDAAMFARWGVPSAMIFVRNAQGSHNPDEAMAMEDFAQGVRILSAGVAATMAAG